MIEKFKAKKNETLNLDDIDLKINSGYLVNSIQLISTVDGDGNFITQSDAVSDAYSFAWILQNDLTVKLVVKINDINLTKVEINDTNVRMCITERMKVLAPEIIRIMGGLSG